MLQKLNERIQGMVAWVVIILIALTFTLFGVDYYMQSKQVSDVEVTVNDEPVTRQAFEINYRRTRQQRDASQLSVESDNALKKQVLEGMIVNLITVQGARKAGFDVSADQADAAIVSIPQFQQDGHFSSLRYQQVLSAALYTPDSFQRQVRQGMLLNQQRFAYMGSAFALPDEVKRFVRLYMQTRNYTMLQIPSSAFYNPATISQARIEAYYNSHKKAFIAPEKVGLEAIELSMQDIKKQIKPSPESIKQYYLDNQNTFQTPAQWRVAHILFAFPEEPSTETEEQVKEKAQAAYVRLKKNPEQFSEAVTTLSADKLSLAAHGVLPWIVAGTTQYDQVLLPLTRVGQIAEPMKTANGYELFQLIEYKPSEKKTLPEVQQDIIQQLTQEAAQTTYAQALEQLTDLSYQTPDSLAPVADALKLPIIKTALFTRKGGAAGLTQQKQVVNAAFSHDVLDLGNNSEPLQLANDRVVVVRVSQHVAASEKPLAEVRNAIIATLSQSEAAQRAETLGNRLLSFKMDSPALNKLLQDNHLHWQTMKQVTRETDKVTSSINDMAFNLPAPNTQKGKLLDNGDYVIVRLNSINDGNYALLDPEQKASLAQQIEASYGIMDYDLYVNQLIAKAGVIRH